MVRRCRGVVFGEPPKLTGQRTVLAEAIVAQS
jgi:hypothetical protein